MNIDVSKKETEHHIDYLHVGSFMDLEGKDRVLYRALEILPGALTWATLLGTVAISYFLPVWAAFFIIIFDLYWLLKTVYLSIHQYHNWQRMKLSLKIDWKAKLSEKSHEHVHHLIIFPYYKESREVIETSLDSLVQNDFNKNKMMVVLASEERAGDEAYELGLSIMSKYKSIFKDFIITRHPADLPGEMAGKGSNIAHAAEEARKLLLDKYNIDYKDVLVSAFDVDTVVYPAYFSCLTWYFVNEPRPLNVSFQPVPLYHNNIWQAPSFSRVSAATSTFWQMIQQERPEKLVTFSSHAMTFETLYRAGYWQKNMVSEDSRIFWNLYFHNNGDYSVIPISYPISMDANLAHSRWQTAINIYKQHRRWTWGVENVPYVLFNFIKNKNISLKTKIKNSFIQIEGFWSLATNPIMILLLGWLPVVIGGERFKDTVLGHELPFITQNLMTISMLGLVLSAILALSLLPPPPKDLPHRIWNKITMVLQWVLVPVIIVIFGAIPGIDAQTRLMLNKGRLGYWVTPKHRKID